MTGPIPARLGNLTSLTLLGLSYSDLTGPIPDELGSLANLEMLDLTENALTGPIPNELGSLENLKWLNLHNNDLAGPIPDELGSLANLKSLSLRFNPLTGSLPESLTGLSELMQLDIRNTAACVPADAEFQAWLATIDFRGVTCNRPPEPVGTVPPPALTESGPAVGVPMEGRFSDPDDDPLTYAAASSRAGTVTAFASGDVVWLVPGPAGTATVTVTASDPDGLSATQPIAVTVDAAAGPQSEREVLEVLYDWTGGAGWTNSRNWKTSAPLGEWYGVTTDPAGRVTELHLDENGLTGLIPNALGDLTRLESLSLRRNELVGPIPAELGNLVDLRSLDLQGNRATDNALTGPIPGELGNLEALDRLDLSVNNLTGPIPGELGNLVNLRVLDFRSNDLTGPIPRELGNLVNHLRYLGLSGNELTGPIPGELGNLVDLDWLDLDSNDLTGPIPRELGNFENLRVLNLGFNDLTGPIPGELGNLVNLRRLDLSYNWGLSGPLPPVARFPRLLSADLVITQACVPEGWWDREAAIEFHGRPCETGPDVTIDVAVFHTPTAREAAGGAAAIAAAIDLMVAETNQAYAASGIHQRLRLVGGSEVAYDETGNSYVDLNRLRDPSDGYMDEVHAVRDRVGRTLWT